MAKPNAGEYPAYYKPFIEIAPQEEPVSSLKESGLNMTNALFGMSEELSSYRYVPNKWSIKQLLGHILDSERVFQFRAMSFARGEKIPLPGFDQDLYVANSNASLRNIESIIKEYVAVRQSSIALFESFSSNDLKKVGVASDAEMSVAALGFILCGHQKHHRDILRERYL